MCEEGGVWRWGCKIAKFMKINRHVQALVIARHHHSFRIASLMLSKCE